MLNERRSGARVRETVLALWGRWIRLSVARRVVATILTAVIAGGAWFTACSGDRLTAPNAPNEPAANPQPGVPRHAVEVNEQRVPINPVYGDPCTMESIAFTGYIHIKIATTIDESGGVHLDLSSDQTSLTGVGMVTQNTYRASDEQHQIENTQGLAPLTMTVIDNFRILGPNPNDNWIMYMHSHFTVNANGVPTAAVDNVQAECR